MEKKRLLSLGISLEISPARTRHQLRGYGGALFDDENIDRLSLPPHGCLQQATPAFRILFVDHQVHFARPFLWRPNPDPLH